MRLSLLVLFIALAFGSTAQPTVIQAESFQSVHIFGPFDVTLVKSSQEKVEVNYGGVHPDDIQIKTSGDGLFIRLKNREIFDDAWDASDWDGDRDVRVKVYFKSLDEIEVRAGARLISDDMIDARSLYLTCSMGAEMELNVKANNVQLTATMGSDVELYGQASSFKLLAKMGADVKAGKLLSEFVSVKASMGADVFVYASRELDISAGFGASVDYTGQASVNHSTKLFGADIHSRRR